MSATNDHDDRHNPRRAECIAKAAEEMKMQADWILVPREPTEAMMKEGARVMHAGVAWSGASRAVARDVYQAMCRAAPTALPGGGGAREAATCPVCNGQGSSLADATCKNCDGVGHIPSAPAGLTETEQSIVDQSWRSIGREPKHQTYNVLSGRMAAALLDTITRLTGGQKS